jgi:Flp pilus assembly protein CpaB
MRRKNVIAIVAVSAAVVALVLAVAFSPRARPTGSVAAPVDGLATGRPTMYEFSSDT